MKLIIGNYTYSSWSLRGWLAAKASGRDFELERILLGLPDTQARILAHSPSGRVPCLVDDDVVVWDSLAIAEYLAEEAPHMWPRARAARAMARAVSAEMHSGFTALRTHMSMNIRKAWPGKGRTPEVEADIARIVALWTACRQRFGVGGPYLFGAWSIADMFYAPVAFRFVTYDVQPGGVAGDYLRALLAHPHVAEWRAAALREVEFIAAYDTYA